MVVAGANFGGGLGTGVGAIGDLFLIGVVLVEFLMGGNVGVAAVALGALEVVALLGFVVGVAFGAAGVGVVLIRVGVVVGRVIVDGLALGGRALPGCLVG